MTGGCSGDIGVAASLAKTYMYYAAKSGDTTAETAAQNIIDVIHQFYGDSLGFSAPETRTDYSNFTSAFNTTNFEGLFIPSGWTGSYPGLGSTQMTSADNTFLSIRPWYTSVANYPEVQNYLNGGAAPVFNYHRFWAEADIATAFDSFAFLFPNVSPPASATPTVTVTNPGTQTGTVGTAETLQVQASDTATGKTLTYSATDLPFGLSLSATTGAITGTPTTAGTYLTTLTANDGSGASSVNLSWTIGPKGTGNVITVTPPANQTGTVGTVASLQIQATDSAAGQTLTYSAAGLPAGLAISSSTGLISGTPTTAGTSSVTVTVSDTTGAKGTAAFTWTVNPQGTHTITVTNPGNQTGTVGTAASLQIQATDSAAGQTLTYSAAGLPAGLAISSSTGLISGTPTAAATSSVTVTVSDTTGAKGTASFTWVINPISSGLACHVTYTPEQCLDRSAQRLHRPGDHRQHRDDHDQRVVADLHLAWRRKDHRQLQRRLLPDRGERNPHQRQLQRHHRAGQAASLTASRARGPATTPTRRRSRSTAPPAPDPRTCCPAVRAGRQGGQDNRPPGSCDPGGLRGMRVGRVKGLRASLFEGGAVALHRSHAWKLRRAALHATRAV